MKVIFDTGSHILWVPTIDCIDSCNYTTNKYDYTQSTRFFQNPSQEYLEIQYGKGYCKGFGGLDQFSLKDSNIQVRHQMMFTYETKDLDGIRFDGILGLSNNLNYQNFLDWAYVAGQIQSNLFAFQIGNRIDNVEIPQTLFYFDDIPNEILNESTFIKVVSDHLWNINLIGLEINGIDSSGLIESNEALVDSGTSLFLVNDELFDELYNKHLYKFCRLVYSNYHCQCSENDLEKYPVITLYFQGIKFELQGKDYVLQIGNQCTLAINYLPGTIPFYILGDVFMRKYIVTFDKHNNQIGFKGGIEIFKLPLLEYIGMITLIITIVGLFLSFYIGFKLNSIDKHQFQNNQRSYSMQQQHHFTGQGIVIGGSNQRNNQDYQPPNLN